MLLRLADRKKNKNECFLRSGFVTEGLTQYQILKKKIGSDAKRGFVTEDLTQYQILKKKKVKVEIKMNAS